MWKKLIQPGEKVPLKLTATERKLVLEAPPAQYRECAQIVRDAPSSRPVMVTAEQLDDFCRLVAFQATHCDDPKKQKKLHAIFEKAHKLLDRTDEEPPQRVKIEDERKAMLVSAQAEQIAEWTEESLAAAQHLRIKTKPLPGFSVSASERKVLLLVPELSKSIKNKLAKGEDSFTVAEVAAMTKAVAEDLPNGDARKQVAGILVARQLIDCLCNGIVALAEPKLGKKKPKPATNRLYQFKITLLGHKPPIWRRIQVQDCTLDTLHEHIQTAMGWTNSHLHQFKIEGERYGDPELLDDGFEDFYCIDSTDTMVSEILTEAGKRFAFKYEYDFGDGWEHEVLFEGCPPIEKGKKYPLCLEGERACPPEDVGGVWGYADFLAAIADPKHEDHKDLLEWSGGSFSPDKFDSKKATREMKKGLPDWRTME